MFSFIAGNWRILGLGVLFVCLLLSIFFLNASNEKNLLTIEKYQLMVESLEQERAQWEALATRQKIAIEGLQDSTLACMEREAKAYEDAKQRESILSKASTRQRTQTEEKEVVDDETRKAVVSRLNRSL